MFQTHGFNEKEFLTDGAFPTAMAARPMAARGMLVLQVREIPISPSVMSSPQEVETMREGYVAAIEQLDAEGLIDPHKVGIVGFSRTGWYVLNTLLHATKYFAAATLAECSYISFGEYLMNADYSGRCARRPRNWAGAKLRSAAYGERIVVTVSRQCARSSGRCGLSNRKEGKRQKQQPQTRMHLHGDLRSQNLRVLGRRKGLAQGTCHYPLVSKDVNGPHFASAVSELCRGVGLRGVEG